MQNYRHLDAYRNDANLRWEHENDLERPYEAIPLTTRTQATSFARRISPAEVMIATPQGVRILRWALPSRDTRPSATPVRPRPREFRVRGSCDPSVLQSGPLVP